MVMLDSIEFYDVFLAAMRIGAVPAPVNPLLPGRDIGGIVAASRAAVLVVSAERAGELDAIRAAAPEVSTVVVTGSPEWEALVGGGTEGGVPWATWDESPGFWLCTSGSTGRPKLAMHRHIDLRVTADTYGAQVLGSPPRRPLLLRRSDVPRLRIGELPVVPVLGRRHRRRRTDATTNARVGRRDRPVAAADVAVLHSDVLRRVVRIGPAGRHVRVRALGSVGGRAAPGRDVSPVRGALRSANPRRHRVDGDDPHLHLQQRHGAAPGDVGQAGARVPRRDRRRQWSAGSGGGSRPPHRER